MNRGYVKVWRKIEDSGLIQLPNTLALFMHLLLNATHKDRKVGTPTGVVELKRGQYISGRIALAARLEQSERQIRTSLVRLDELGIISIQTTNRFSIYTIENYNKYQDIDIPNDQQTTNKRPTNDQQTTTKQELNNLNMEEGSGEVIDFPKPIIQSNNKFSMHPEWTPSDSFESLCVSAGIRIIEGQEPVDELQDFRTYWLTRLEINRTQSEWEFAFIKNMKSNKLRAKK